MIVVGGSLGGLQATQSLLSSLPGDFGLPVAIVLHRAPSEDDLLTPLLQNACVLRVSEIIDKDPIEPGRVYVAPPDYHVLVEPGYLSLSVDERVNHARPSIDVLFESAALSYGERAIGVILTGSGSDGARGAASIEACGGRVLIEDPATAYQPEMPVAARSVTRTPTVQPLQQLALTLCELARTSTSGGSHASGP